MEEYIQQGISGEYEIPKNPAWNPFQTIKTHDLPPRILEQANNSGVGMTMGLFAPLSHQWAAMDNCLYLWDYTLPNPELIGYEENTHTITAVKLVKPKPGVFVKEIEYLIVLTTTAEMLLLGVAATQTATGANTITLYNTRMSIPVRGLSVTFICASEKTGRIFFTGSTSPSGDDIYEFQYQSEEGWFSGRCRRVDHTNAANSFVGAPKMLTNFGVWSTKPAAKQIVQLTIDDTRGLMYSLSSNSEIKIWLLRENLALQATRPLSSLLQNAYHFTSRTETLSGPNVRLINISAIPATEASNTSFIATTNTGCRLYINAINSAGYGGSLQNPPTSVQVKHIRYPPSDPNQPTQMQGQQQQPGQAMQPYQQTQSGNVDRDSRLLTVSHGAVRFPPGYFLTFTPDDSARQKADKLFVSATDLGRMKNPQDTSQVQARFSEFGQWIQLPAELQQVVRMSDEYGATATPVGFGNELAVQFDKPVTELAILTQLGMTTIRRRRLVDTFASLIRSSSSSSNEEGLEGDIKRFIRSYGRAETAATALAVACGQGVDVTPDARVASISDPEVLERARKAFIEEGGKPEYNQNAAVDGPDPVSSVRPSPRHDGMALYVSRLVRSIWKSTIMKEVVRPGEPVKLESAVNVQKLRGVQKDLNELQKFLNANRSFIEGLSGPQALGRLSTRQEEIALQGEHRAMNSLVQLIASIIEGISFVLVLFDENVTEILLALTSDDSRRKAKELTYEGLFVTPTGRELAKELVKAIVNRNIANGSNVDTVAEALRRRCGSFCSADDVVIFKAQEQVKRAQEAGFASETGRVLLNESQRLFSRVAASLSFEHLHWAVSRYVDMQFFAGAIQLCLVVAAEKDRAKRAMSWMKDGFPQGDDRQAAWNARKQIYDLVFAAIQQLDTQTQQAQEVVDGQYTVQAKRRNEAYDIINSSDDPAFQTCLFDWYLEHDQADRLLETDNGYVVEYLRKKAEKERPAADLLWRYYAHNNDFLEAAATQLDMARGFFDLNLEERIGYLSRARTNASTRQSALTTTRQSKQQLLREISDLLEVGNIQDDILQRMKVDPRLTDERRPQVLESLDRHILEVGELFNQYADQAGYHDICIMIYQVADHRNPADIRTSWQALIEQTDKEATTRHGRDASGWEAVGEQVRSLGLRLHTADATFPIQTLLPMLERYAIEPHRATPPRYWVIDIFLDLDVPHETLLPVLEQIFYSNEHPFVGSKRRVIAAHMIYLLQQWYQDSERKGERIVFSSEENASIAQDTLGSLIRSNDIEAGVKQEAENLMARVNMDLR